MMRRRTISVRLYSAEKNAVTGNGYTNAMVAGSATMSDDERAAAVAELKRAQKEANRAYRDSGRGLIAKAARLGTDAAPAEPVLAQPTEPVPPAVAEPVPPALAPGPIRTPFELKLDAGTGNTTYLIGASKQGKSTMLMRLYDTYYAPRKIISILWTANPQIAIYRKHANLIVADGWGKAQEAIVLEQHRIQKRTKNEYRFLNMFDDLVHLRDSPVMADLILTYRNSKMSTIVSMQYSKLLQRSARANVNNVLLFGQNTDENIEGVINVYLRGYLRGLGIRLIPDQINWYKAATADHAFIYVRPADSTVSFHRLQI